MKMLNRRLLLLVLGVFTAGFANAAGLENGTVLNVKGSPRFSQMINPLSLFSNRGLFHVYVYPEDTILY